MRSQSSPLNRLHARAFLKLTLLLWAAQGPVSGAAESHGSPVTLSGYGTLGLVHSSEKHADFVGAPTKARGAGHTTDWSADVDSVLAGQVTAQLGPRVAAVLQIVSELGYDDTYRPHVEWASLQYDFTPDLNVRIGRTALPTFALTDTRRVGYVMPWVRPPVELYGLVPPTSNDGIEASYRVALRGGVNTLRATYGRSRARYPASPGFGAISPAASGLFTVVDTFEKGFASLRLNYGRSRLSISELDPLFNALASFGNPGVKLANRYNVDHKVADFLGAGASYDPEHWFASAEWGTINTRSALGDRTAWYVSVGRRLGDFTPFVTYSRVDADSAMSDAGIDLASVPADRAAVALAANAELNAVLGAIAAQRTLSAGLRWDVAAQVALKAQYDYIDLATGSSGTLSNLQPQFQPGGSFHVISATLNFVF